MVRTEGAGLDRGPQVTRTKCARWLAQMSLGGQEQKALGVQEIRCLVARVEGARLSGQWT